MSEVNFRGVKLVYAATAGELWAVLKDMPNLDKIILAEMGIEDRSVPPLVQLLKTSYVSHVDLSWNAMTA
jgi:hypothetical protein